ncbi:unnamed protein product [Adineta steineri]|uniref:RING-type domain-containing protein n=1 Tax=Adineta steineri TaxID=433720 RepID=A0A816D9E7_9BILA|nr:unnamed protein product [Adineta steineri]CAF1632967.1 unnamed protein product [Adineta steineri]
MVGIDAQNKNILDRKFICSDCSLILRDPVQLTACGHRLCHSCSLNQNQTLMACSQCHMQTPSDQILVDRGFKNDMRTLPIICSYCDWAGTLQNYEKHLEQLHQHSIANEAQQTKLSTEEKIASVVVEGVNKNLDILIQNLPLPEENINNTQCVSYDGTLIWKITSFNEKMMDAKSKRQPSIYSPPFYSSPTGYKMRAELYLHEDGNAGRTYMSLCFVLMRGSYDAILKFPFNYKVTFCLYDQTPQQRHIIDSFRPYMESNSFQRSRSEVDIASGILKFVSLGMIQQEGNPYVRDDTMFIKIMVDFGDIPTTLLSYALNLNPGLPMHIQQSMIEEEQNKRLFNKENTL